MGEGRVKRSSPRSFWSLTSDVGSPPGRCCSVPDAGPHRRRRAGHQHRFRARLPGLAHLLRIADAAHGRRRSGGAHAPSDRHGGRPVHARAVRRDAAAPAVAPSLRHLRAAVAHQRIRGRQAAAPRWVTPGVAHRAGARRFRRLRVGVRARPRSGPAVRPGAGAGHGPGTARRPDGGLPAASHGAGAAPRHLDAVPRGRAGARVASLGRPGRRAAFAASLGDGRADLLPDRAGRGHPAHRRRARLHRPAVLPRGPLAQRRAPFGSSAHAPPRGRFRRPGAGLVERGAPRARRNGRRQAARLGATHARRRADRPRRPDHLDFQGPPARHRPPPRRGTAPRRPGLAARADPSRRGAGAGARTARGAGMTTAAMRDYVELAKPRITTLVVFTCASGLWLAPGRLPARTVLFTLVGTVLIVAAANVLNMYLERDTDALMKRTMNRPLPAGRLDPQVALRLGLALAAVSVPLLTFAVGPLPGLLASVALVSYVLLYTPLKRYTAAALLVGAVPGAIPPLIGWTAATERLDLPGVLLFAVMFLWQVPHFLAITLFRREEYARAGLVVQPNEPGGEREARRNIVRYTVALVAVSLLFVPLGIGRGFYFATALLSGLLFLGYGIRGLRADAGERWARNEFLFSLGYLTILFAVLMLDHGPPG